MSTENNDQTTADTIETMQDEREPRTVCQLDSEGYFIGTTFADPDPLNLDNYLIPAGCIDVAAPDTAPGIIARWDGDKWVEIENHIGETVYSTADGRAIVIDQLGAYPANTTIDPRPTPYHSWWRGKWHLSAEAAQQQLNDAKRERINSAARKAEVFIDVITDASAVPEFERLSWAKQAEEAESWAADNSTPTPALARIAHSRGVPLDMLRQKALEKSRAYQTLITSVAGQRQKIEDQIKAADSLEALNAIIIEYTLPQESDDA